MPDLIERVRDALADRYAVEREVGAGGMATVFEAEDLRHHRMVAVKVLRSELAATLGPDRFLKEIEIAAGLQHPHILPLYDSGEASGFLFYVMPLAEGESLRSRLDREGELPVVDVARILRDVADALDYAHGRGVVHRDVKPANVLLSGRHALITDFGVAKAVSEATGRRQLTTAGVAMGTPHYMAPEQAAADPAVDHRADIYAFGVLAYELLTGDPPFAGRAPQMVLSAHVTEPPAPVTDRRAAVPPLLAEMVMRCLAKKPADRWQSAGELLPRLEALTTPSGGMTPTDTRPVPVETGSRVRGWIVVGGVVALLALGGASLVGLFSGNEDVAFADDRVLVGVFQNETGDPAQDPVGKIIADWLTRGLHETGLVEVVDERSVGAEPTEGGTPAHELRQLAVGAGAGLIVSGSYYRTGDRLELQGQILNASDGSVIRALGPMSAEVDEPQPAIREMRERMMGAFANILDPRFGAVAPGSSPPSYEAYQAFIAGDELFFRRDYAEAAEQLLAAYDLDTTFAVAAVRAAVAYNNAGRCDAVDSIGHFLNAKRQSVVPYDRYYLDRIVARCRAEYGAHVAAAEEMMRVAPRSDFAIYLAGRSALWVNRVRHGLELLESVDPRTGVMRPIADQLMRDIATAHHQLGDYEGEKTVLERWDGWAEAASGHESQVRILAGQQRVEEALSDAVEAASRIVARGGDFWPADIVCHAAREIHAHGSDQDSRPAREACLDAVVRGGAALDDSVRFLPRLGDALFRLGRLEQAAGAYGDLLRLVPEHSSAVAPLELLALGRLGVIATMQGDEEAARRWEARLRAYDSPYVGGRPGLWRAKMAVARGDRDQAVALLRQAFSQGLSFWSSDHGDRMHVEVGLAPLFDDPAYRAMVAPRE